jgi:hypothetical protein
MSLLIRGLEKEDNTEISSVLETGNLTYLLSNAPSPLRHLRALQLARRDLLARSRSWLLSTSLTPEVDWVIWMDVDVVEFRQTLVQDLIALAKLRFDEREADVLVPNCMWKTYNEMGQVKTRIALSRNLD